MKTRTRFLIGTMILATGCLLLAVSPVVDNLPFGEQQIAYAQGETTQLANPLGEGTTIQVIIGRVIQALLAFSGAVALLMFVYGGFMWLTSGGNPDRIQKGKQTLIWAVIGLVVIFTSYTLVNTVINALAGAS